MTISTARTNLREGEMDVSSIIFFTESAFLNNAARCVVKDLEWLVWLASLRSLFVK